MTKIYHLALLTDWQSALNTGNTYYPPTYQQDGFTHGTGEAARLITVANHFYRESKGDWICLEMTEQHLSEQGIAVKYEPAASVGDKDGALSDTSDTVLFPHIYGGIPPEAVTASYEVERAADGTFVKISEKIT